MGKAEQVKARNADPQPLPEKDLRFGIQYHIQA